MASLTVCIPTLCIKKTGLQRSVTEMISSWSSSFHLLSFSVHLFRSREGDKRSHRIVHLKATVSKGGLQRGACVLDVDTGKRSKDDRVGVQRDGPCGLSWRSKKKAGGDFSRMPLSRRVSSFHLIPPPPGHLDPTGRMRPSWRLNKMGSVFLKTTPAPPYAPVRLKSTGSHRRSIRKTHSTGSALWIDPKGGLWTRGLTDRSRSDPSRFEPGGTWRWTSTFRSSCEQWLFESNVVRTNGMVRVK